MIGFEWLSDRLGDVLRWQLANPGRPADAPEIPYAGQRVWDIFLRLHESRGGGGFGPSPISYEAMEAFSVITGEVLRTWEIEIVRVLDREWMKAVTSKSDTGTSTAPVSTRPMSPALFDAMFS
jgi:hypothetical protein